MRGVMSRSTAGSSARFRNVRDAHRREHDPERLLGPEDLGLAGDLQGDLVVRQAGPGEEGKFLAADEGVESVDRRDAGLDELRRVLPRIRVDRRPDNLDPFLRHDRRSAVDRFAGPAQDPPQHVSGHVELDRLAEELHGGLAVDPRRPLEDLDDDDVLRRVEDLTSLARSIRQADLDEFAVSDPRRLLDEDERPRDLRDRPIFRRHLTWLPVS
jgi:hypothetical protein